MKKHKMHLPDRLKDFFTESRPELELQTEDKREELKKKYGRDYEQMFIGSKK